MSLTGAGKVAGVIGWPIAHSLSPLLHGYWLREYRVDGVLVPLAVRRQDFARVVMALRQAGLTGVNVTVPHKEAAFALADACDAAARAAGAANLLVFHADGRIEGRNTDAIGLRESLRQELGGALKGKTAILLGAGGAARGAVLGLAEQGVERVHILNRHADRARALAAALQPMVSCRLVSGVLADWAKAAPEAALLVNATSAGMPGCGDLELPLGPLPRGAVVCDMVYNPLETGLLKDARALGNPTIDGLGMLMHQAAPSFQAFFQVEPRVTMGLRAALEQALKHA
jgi:shikimate dehydrogenase